MHSKKDHNIMKRDINQEDIEIINKLGYKDTDIEYLYTKAYKAKSFPEQYLAEVLSNNYNKVISNMKMTNGMELDIAIFDINTGIEYSGKYYHTNIERDKRKREYIEQHGVKLITITEYNVSSIKEEKVDIIDDKHIEIYRVARGKNLEPLVSALGKLLNKDLTIPDDIYYKVKERIYTSLGKQSLFYKYPELAKEYSKNNKIAQNRVFISDSDTVEWVCSKCNNKFYTSVSHRVYQHTNCPYCAGNLAIPGKTDILTILPEYAKEIISITEDELRETLPYSTKQVTWKCSRCSNIWKSTIINRTRNKTGCPICSYIPTVYEDKWYNIKELYKDPKPIKQIELFSETYNITTYTKFLNIALNRLSVEYSKELSEIVDNSEYTTIKYHIPILSKNNTWYRKPNYFNLNGTKIYYETHCCTQQMILTLLKIIDYIRLDYSTIKARIDADKINNKAVKYVNKAKNGEDWNVSYRLKIGGKSQETFIGSRPTFNEAVLLKLSLEIFYFGKIRDKSDEYNGEIPRFEDLPEYIKLGRADKLVKQYT